MRRFLSNPYYSESPDWSGLIADSFGAEDISELHSSVPSYDPTPLIELPGLAANLGIGRLLIKDEAHRFGLKAFKALGATYAIYRLVREYLNDRDRPCPRPDQFYATKDVLTDSELTFCTATDGNHGRGVAWVARLLRQEAVIFMPAESVPARIENIRREGARVVVVDGTYDDCVRRCAIEAGTNGWQTISDTSWTGYERIPSWIMAGYLTLFREIEAALAPTDRIDLVVVQGGVGALAGATAWYFHKLWLLPRPKLVSAEPTQAACLLESIASPAGDPILSAGRQDSIMAGLNCGMPSPVAWPLIKQGFNQFLSVSDESCVKAMRTYHDGQNGDPRIISGESGAAGMAAMLELMQESALAGAYSDLGLGPDTNVLLLNTEGDTDSDSFQRQVLRPNSG